ncbi:17818_t:CDS:2, partial [Funneliformis geosporum]
TNLLDDGPIFYYVLLIIDYVTRFKDFVFLTSKSSEEVAEAFKSTEFMRHVTLLINEYSVEIRKIIACFSHTSLAMVDRYAGLFELRVFKNQYSIEFLLPTGKCCRECKRFARRIVDNMNDTLTQLIRISPNDATKLKREELMLTPRWVLGDN